MREHCENGRSRREMIAGVCRYGALGLLSAGAAGIYAKRRHLVRQGKCIGGGICEGCEILARCDLPRALSAREALIGGNNAGE